MNIFNRDIKTTNYIMKFHKSIYHKVIQDSYQKKKGAQKESRSSNSIDKEWGNYEVSDNL